MLIFAQVLKAENYYLNAVESLSISAEQLEKSRKKVKEHKTIEIKDELEVPPFHKRDEWEKESLSKTFCTGCHLSPPHTKNLRSRAFMNMHTQFIACETCHLRPEKQAISYQWFDYRNQQPVPPKPELFRQIMDKKDQPKREEAKQRVTDPLIKIIPVINERPSLIFNDHEFAKKTQSIWKDGTFEEKVQQRAKIHVVLEEKGPKCDACHQTENPMLDLKALGANSMQVTSMQNHIVPQFFKRYSEDDQKIRINSLLK